MKDKEKNVLDQEIKRMVYKERNEKVEDQDKEEDKLSKLPTILGILMGLSIILGLVLSLLAVFNG
ncbi:MULTISPECIES: hypothetical protein [Aerococcus]|uniref:hypothetical protein n=1 Tax=Aerococcus urinae (strain CCUG 59500 / ACS-120-V-Col10a) TaxID=2976812 RepID=UPI000200EA6F|nr:hypothetical protein [Aerococcus sp. Group 1]AEA01360.1 hypothetical protein HMPREF9243_0772 [Aerococcus sp. Group 1]MCY3031107.1 hypothetical protein [Aerococcus sp. Group 1]MCY3054257.1 hypothetical protein [Aerococcus sp. Group 1]MCY3055987.1 hypothetical protein [Aerococcus sp. Group 1]MCY3061867.1 hypothetical protein [Aerococcus sp. Group 1]